MEISIYSSDVRDFDKEVERKFDIQDQFGAHIFNDRGYLSRENYDYDIEPYTYLSVILSQQEQIERLRESIYMLRKDVEQLKKKTGWVSGYDDHGWNTK